MDESSTGKQWFVFRDFHWKGTPAIKQAPMLTRGAPPEEFWRSFEKLLSIL